MVQQRQDVVLQQAGNSGKLLGHQEGQHTHQLSAKLWQGAHINGKRGTTMLSRDLSICNCRFLEILNASTAH